MASAWSSRAVLFSLAAGLAAGVSTSCTWARPAVHDLVPGQSASFNPNQLRVSERFSRTFCSVLETEYGARWDSCDRYVQMPAAHPPAHLDALHTDRKLLLIAGFGAQCLASKLTVFADAATHLHAAHQVSSHHLPVGAFDSSEQNALLIRNHIAGQPPTDRFIVIAHSKGAADVMVALAKYPQELQSVEAVITIAGAVGGSHLVDHLQPVNDAILKKIGLPDCVGTRADNALDSMRRDKRQRFLSEHNPPPVKAFSISAVSTIDSTSTILKPLWKRLLPYAREQDSHLLEREAIVPWGSFLGRALGDHWAVAMPFTPDRVSARVLEVVDKNAFPREALVEAALRTALEPAPYTRTSAQR